MVSRSLLVFSFFLVVTGCANTAITEPVIANTGTARSSDGYEAAIATAEAEGYTIVVRDPQHAFVRVQSRSSRGVDPAITVYFDVKAWSGSVDIHIAAPPSVTLGKARLSAVQGERNELAWSISTRARLIAGEPILPATTDPLYNYEPPILNYPLH
jgi:hypothetical protein